MACKTILLHLNDVRRAGRLLEAAVPLARAANAHLVGLAVVPPYVVLPAMDGGGASATIEDHREAFRSEMTRLAEMFRRATAELPLPAEWLEADAAFDSVAARLLEHCRTADLIVASQADVQWSGSALLEDPVRIVMESGRPVLLIPNAGRTALPPRRATIAWDGRREAARATFDALPLLAGAEEVAVVWINPERAGGGAGDLPGSQVCAALARHGIRCQAVDAHAIGADVGPELLRQAKVQGADLLVMGCYGHSRLRELILGGASRHVLAHMDRPVLMSH